MENEQKIKQAVREKYGEIVSDQAQQTTTGCCGPEGSVEELCCFSEGYDQLEGYVADADYGLGCGLPTEHALIKEGDTVLDLGSGAGNDCFVARSITGENGYVIGVDMTPEMVFKARENSAKLNYNNVVFRLGEIEAMPVETDTVNVVVSNCVINLIPDKLAAFKEIYRVLKPGGHFSISDIVINGELPEKLKNDLAAYAGCISGANNTDDYLQKVKNAGFENVDIRQSRSLQLPDEVLDKHPALKSEYKESKSFSLESITVYGEKPKIDAQEEAQCCDPKEEEKSCC